MAGNALHAGGVATRDDCDADRCRIPISQVANILSRMGAPSIKTEGARPQGWIYVDLDPREDVGSYVARAQKAVANAVKFPPGYTIEWSGQYEYMREPGSG